MTAFARRVEVVRDFLDGLPPTEGRAAITEQLSTSVPRMFERMNFVYDAFYDVRHSDTVIA